jgi:hypothetical protein
MVARLVRCSGFPRFRVTLFGTEEPFLPQQLPPQFPAAGRLVNGRAAPAIRA